MTRRVLGAALGFLLATVPVLATQLPAGQPTPAQEGYVPINQLPPSQQLPAAPFVIAAYAFIWVALIAYLWSIWRRLRRLTTDLERLERRSSSAVK